MGQAAQALAAGLKRDAIVSDVGSSKAGVAAALREALPGHIVIPAHPVAGTENSGPAAGFATLFEGRWCIVTPGHDAPAAAGTALPAFWPAPGPPVDRRDGATPPP